MTCAKYIAKEGIDPATFNQMTPPQQAWAILQDGTPDMKKEVILATDPTELATFKRVQQSLIYTGCASCHIAGKVRGNSPCISLPMMMRRHTPTF